MSPRSLAFAVALVLALGAGRPARAEYGPFGLGLILGSPTGISWKVYLNKKSAIDGAIGGEVLGTRGFGMHADYLWHPVMLTQEQGFFLPLYVGAGVRLMSHDRPNGLGSDVHFGLRAPVGIVFDLRKIPLDIFLEVALVIDLIQDDSATDRQIVDLNTGLGARYYF